MHIIFDLAPFYREACAVGTEYGIRGIFQICLRVVSCRRHHRLLVVAGGVAQKAQLELPLSLGVGRHLLGIVPQLRGRHLPGEDGVFPAVFRRLRQSPHGPDVGDGPTHLGGGHNQGKPIPGFQEPGLCLHQSLAHRPVGCLAEVAPFCVL